METNLPLDDDFSTSHGLAFNNIARHYMATAAKWARFLSIVGFVFVGLITIGMIAFGTFFADLMASDLGGLDEDFDATAAAGVTTGVMIFYWVIIVGIYLVPNIFLYKFATKMRSALQTSSSNDLETSTKNLSNLFQFMGILTIIMLGLYGLMLLGLVAVGAAGL